MSWRLTWLERWDEVRDEAFVADWRARSKAAAGHPGFQLPEVVLPWFAECAEPAGTTPCFGLAEHPSGARALLPWVRGTYRGRLGSRRVLEPALGDLAGYTDPLFTGELVDLSGLWRRVRESLAGEVEQGLFRFVHRDLAPPGAPASSDESPVLELPAGASFEALLARTSANHRGDLGRRFRRLAERGEIRLELLHDPQAATQQFEGRFHEAYARQWRSTASGSLLDRPGVKAFLRRLLTTETAHFSALTVAGEPIAWHLGILFRGELYWWFPTYDPSWASFSPGKVLLARLLEHGLAARWSRVHFLTGGHDYKLAWRPRPADLATVRWFAPSLHGRLLGIYDRLRRSR